MANTFSTDQWDKIFDFAKDNAERFGLPKKRRNSVVLGSFNIRKLGDPSKKSKSAWKLIEMICKRYDLLAVQEVQSDLNGIKHLKSLLGNGYGLVASDVTGSYPGEHHSPERLAFLYRWRIVQRTEVASDITYDRTKMLNTLFEFRNDFIKAFEEHQQTLDQIDIENVQRKVAGSPKKSKPGVPTPHFLTFIRQPLLVSFEVKGRHTQNPYRFMAVNCHLLYGTDKEERRSEFLALLAWLIERAKNYKKSYYPNLILMGDCNLEFKNPARERPEIDSFIKQINSSSVLGKTSKVNFPFLDVHPGQSEVFRSSARLKYTYDQIGIFARDSRLPDHMQNLKAGSSANGYDYGVFNFVDMFSHALHGKPYNSLLKSEKSALCSKFQHDFTDHLPIWIRLPKP